MTADLSDLSGRRDRGLLRQLREQAHWVGKQQVERHLRTADEDGVAAERRGHDDHLFARGREGQRQLLGHIIRCRAVNRGEVPTKDNRLRVQHMEEVHQSDAEPGRDLAYSTHGRRIALASRLDHINRRRRIQPIGFRRVDQGLCSHLGLPASDSTTAAGPTRGIHANMTHLATVATRSDESLTVDNDAAADADIASQEDQRIDLLRRTAQVFGKRTEVGIVADLHAACATSERVTKEPREWNIDPAEIRSLAHESILRTYDARHSDAGSDPGSATRGSGQDLPPDVSNLPDDAAGIAQRIDMSVLHAGEHFSAKPDEGPDRSIHAHIEGEGHGR